MDRIKAFFKSEGAKMKEMNGQEKRWYIWEYYKVHILVTVMVLFMLGGLIDSLFINKPKTAYFHIGWMASFQTADELALFSQAMTTAIVEDATREEVIISSFVMTGDNLMYDNTLQQRFMAMLSAGELHAFIVEEEDYVQGLAEAEIIRPLDKVMAELAELDKDLHDRILPHLLYASYVSERTGEAVNGYFGLPLRGSTFLESLGIHTDNLFLCKVVVAGHDFPTAQAIQVLYE